MADSIVTRYLRGLRAFFLLLPWWITAMLAGLVVLALAVIWPSSAPHPDPAAQAGAARAIASSDKRKQACRAAAADLDSQYAALMAERKFWAAADKVRECAQLLDDPALKLKIREGEVQSYLAEINDPKGTNYSKASAVRGLLRHYPDFGQKYQALGARYTAAAEREEAADRRKLAADEARRKRSEGVHVGMTQADVLASSWGKPREINRTTTAHRTHEQWVYGGRSYLYFDDGILTAIQN